MADASANLLLTVKDATRAGFAAAEASAKKFGARVQSALGAIGFGGFSLSLAAVGAALTKVTLDGIEFGDQIAKGAARAGVGVEAFSKLAFAADQADIELQSLSKALQTMQLGLAKTTAQGGGFTDELRDLGIVLADLDRLSPDQKFLKIADAVGQVDDVQQRTRIGTALFGKAFADLAPAIEGGADALREAADNAKLFRLELSEKQVAALTQADDALKALTLSLKGLGIQFAAEAAQGVTAFAEFAQQLFGTLTPLQEIETKLRILREAKEGIPIVFDFLGKIDDGKFVMGPEAIKKEIAKLEAARDKLLAPKDTGGGPAINDQLEVAGPGDLKIGFDLVLRNDVLKEVQDTLLAIEGEVERNRILGRQLSAEQQQSIIENEQDYFAELQANVLSNYEAQASDSEQVIEAYFDRIAEMATEKNEFLTGAAEEFGRSVQSSLSDVFFNAGKGADSFATSVLNAFKRILADAAANKVVELIGGLFGAKKDTGVGGGSSTGGFLSTLASAFIGGARADGGPVSGGSAYLVGERGPEIFMPGQSGTILPNNALGRSANVNVDARVSVDARGATQDGMKALMAQLPVILEQRDRKLKAEISMAINRGQFGLKG